MVDLHGRKHRGQVIQTEEMIKYYCFILRSAYSKSVLHGDFNSPLWIFSLTSRAYLCANTKWREFPSLLVYILYSDTFTSAINNRVKMRVNKKCFQTIQQKQMCLLREMNIENGGTSAL